MNEAKPKHYLIVIILAIAFMLLMRIRALDQTKPDNANIFIAECKN